MSLVGRLVDRAGQARRDFSGPWGHLDGSIPAPGDDGRAAGMVVTELTALRLTSVYACVSLIADTVSTLPVNAVREVGTTREPVSPPWSLLASPHPEMDWPDWVSRILFSLLLRGNSYGLIGDVDRLGYPVDILPLHPDDCRPRRDRRTKRIEYQLNGGETARAWPNGRIWHIRGLARPGDIEGLNPIALARTAIGLGLAADSYGANFFADSAHPSGVIESGETLTGESGRDRAKRIAQMWKATHGSGHRNPAVLGKDTHYKPIQLSPNDAQFLETRKFSVSDIARIFRVPPHMIADVEKSTSWGTGIEQQGIGFVTFTLRHWLTRLEYAMAKLLPRGQVVRFNVAGLLRGDLKSRFEAYATARQWGWLSVNDILALEDLPPIEGGDTYLQPLNMVPAGTQITRAERDALGTLSIELEELAPKAIEVSHRVQLLELAGQIKEHRNGQGH